MISLSKARISMNTFLFTITLVVLQTSPTFADSVTTLGAPGVQASSFEEGALVNEITTESCTLTNGTETDCYRIEVAGAPVGTKIGPFCPEKTDTTATDSGIWLDGSKIYDADGQFILDLATIYGDAKWKLYDETGKVAVTDTKEAFQGAARPDVAEEYKYHCVEGTWDWTDTGKPVPTSILVPVTPIKSDSVGSTESHGNLGVTLNGLVISAPAPVDAILGAYTIAAFDDCGGHFNPIAGYHLHAYTSCEGTSYEASIEDPNAETSIIGYAMDGVAIFAPLSAQSTIELDECNGRTTEKDGYHYYAQSAEKNLVVKCTMGLTAVDSSVQAGPPGGPAGVPSFVTPANAKWFIGGLVIALIAAVGSIWFFANRKRKVAVNNNI